MAKGRMISKSTAGDRKFNDLPDDTCRLAFLLLVSFADREGRTYGDPKMVRSMIFPRRDDIAIEQIEQYLQNWHDNGMIVRYEAEGDMWIWFPNFEKHQPGMRKEREPASEIPAPPAEIIRQFSANHPEDFRPEDGLKEGNGIKENGIEGKAGGENDADTAFFSPAQKPLIEAFTKATGIYAPAGGGHQTKKWHEALMTLVKARASPEEIAATVQDMLDRGLSIAGPWSIINGVNVYRAKQRARASPNDQGEQSLTLEEHIKKVSANL